MTTSTTRPLTPTEITSVGDAIVTLTGTLGPGTDDWTAVDTLNGIESNGRIATADMQWARDLGVVFDDDPDN